MAFHSLAPGYLGMLESSPTVRNGIVIRVPRSPPYAPGKRRHTDCIAQKCKTFSVSPGPETFRKGPGEPKITSGVSPGILLHPSDERVVFLSCEDCVEKAQAPRNSAIP